jgi:hypothetical protein
VGFSPVAGIVDTVLVFVRGMHKIRARPCRAAAEAKERFCLEEHDEGDDRHEIRGLRVKTKR